MEKSEDNYLTVMQIRKLKGEHGPLIMAQWSSSSSGMMMGSIARSSMKLYRVDGEVRLVHKDMRVYEPEYTSVYAADEELFDRLQQLSDRENLPSWGLLRADPDKMMQILDYSSSSSITLTYDDVQIGKDRPIEVSFSWEAVRQQNAAEVWEEILEILREGIDPERLLESSSEPNPYKNPFAQMTTEPAGSDRPENKPDRPVYLPDGTWKCPSCGAEGNTGKFCCECGSRGPEE